MTRPDAPGSRPDRPDRSEPVEPVEPVKPVNRLGPVHGLVLYKGATRWQFAVYAEGGVLDGYLCTALACSEEEAQHTLLTRLYDWTGRRLKARWHGTDPDWWAAEVVDAT